MLANGGFIHRDADVVLVHLVKQHVVSRRSVNNGFGLTRCLDKDGVKNVLVDDIVAGGTQ